MKKIMLGAVALVAVGVAPALAADLPARTYTKAPAVVPVAAYNWTGCYVGGNVGWIGGNDQSTNYPGPTIAATIPLTPAQVAAITNSSTASGSGVTGGAQIGCNWQAASHFVVGVEADFNGSSLKESTTASYPSNATAGFTAHSENNNNSLTWYSTVRGRVGYAADRWFFYATGGLAVAHINSSLNLNFIPPPNGYFGSDSVTRTGYAVGAGLEYAINNNWSAKIEYLYLDFGTLTFASPLNTDSTLAWATNVHARDNIVRVGLNYHFGGPVVAKY
jgi:outer membrane immunogenic protein